MVDCFCDHRPSSSATPTCTVDLTRPAAGAARLSHARAPGRVARTVGRPHPRPAPPAVPCAPQQRNAAHLFQLSGTERRLAVRMPYGCASVSGPPESGARAGSLLRTLAALPACKEHSVCFGAAHTTPLKEALVCVQNLPNASLLSSLLALALERDPRCRRPLSLLPLLLPSPPAAPRLFQFSDAAAPDPPCPARVTKSGPQTSTMASCLARSTISARGPSMSSQPTVCGRGRARPRPRPRPYMYPALAARAVHLPRMPERVCRRSEGQCLAMQT